MNKLNRHFLIQVFKKAKNEMVLPVIEHRLTKIGHANRLRFIRIAFCFSAVACFANLISNKRG